MTTPVSGSSDTVTVFLGLGSNLGDREPNIRTAIVKLAAHPKIDLIKMASIFQTAPVGGPSAQPPYLNTAAGVRTTLTPVRLLDVVLEIESSLGRVRSQRWAPREIDIDILLCGDLIIADERLSLPHPRLHERGFVLEPLVEIAGDVVHPVLNLTIAQLARQRRAGEGPDSVVRILES